MPLAELISDFDDRLKSVSEGFASFNYELSGYQKGELEKMEILVAGAPVAGLIRVIPKKNLNMKREKWLKKLKNILPHQQFSQAIQAISGGRIVARETLPAMKKMSLVIFTAVTERVNEALEKTERRKKEAVEHG